MILLKNKNKKANIKIGNNIEIKDGSDFPFDLTLYGQSTQETRSGKNLFNKYGDFTYGATNNRTSLQSDGTILSTSNFGSNRSSGLLIESVKSNTDYTLSGILISADGTGIISNNIIQILTTANSPIKNFSVPSSEAKPFNFKFTFNSGENASFWISLNGWNSTTEGTTNTVFDNIQLEEGTVATEYEPYGVMPSPDFPSPIESITEISATVTGKNLFDGVIEAGYININTGQNTGSINIRTKNYIPIQPNTQYTISSDTSHDTWACYYDNNFSFISNRQIKSNTSGTFTTPNNAYYIRWYDAISTAETPEWQLEEGTQATSYEEYKSNSLTINLQGNELCSLPNGTKDEVNITNGEALLIKRVGKVVLDGSENWIKLQIGSTGKYYFKYTTSDLGQVTSNPSVLSNYFVQSTTWSEQSVGIWFDTNLIIKTEGSLNNTETVNEFKTWLSTHNVEVLYELAEPETINLGTVEMPHTYEGVSNITNSADTEMVVKYYKKFEFDKILRSGYNIDEQEYEIAKKQMANGKRKKILSSYVDCIIKIDLGLLDNKTYQEYKEQLEDGEYEYWSYKYNQYKKANFILTKPSITTEYAYDDDIGIDDMEITLEKSSDVS